MRSFLPSILTLFALWSCNQGGVSVRPVPAPSAPIVDGFDFPVGAPHALGYYDAQPFGTNKHLGEDWNRVGGASADLGDPVYAVGHGRVEYASAASENWGLVVRVVHKLPEGREIESVYAHLDRMDVYVGQIVTRGDRIGTIGDANGSWLPHLHFEMRATAGLALGSGYGENVPGYIAPSSFIVRNRPGELDTGAP